MGKRLWAVAAAVALLTPPWLGWPGFSALVGLVPMLWLSEQAGSSRRAWWGVFGWALLFFVAWNLSTIWWIGYASWVGPFGATTASSIVGMTAYMLFHSADKRTPRALSYTILIAAWIATEYWYTRGSFSWPWLLLGNAFTHDIWAIQWYEYTGVFGGTLWVLLCNILIYEALRRRVRWYWPAAAAVIPLLISLTIFFTYKVPQERTIRVTAVQPNIDPYDKFGGMSSADQLNLFMRLAGEAPAGTDVVVLPETAIQGQWDEAYIEQDPAVKAFKGLGPFVVTGAETTRWYDKPATDTARSTADGRFYDVFNTTLGVAGDVPTQIHHKGKLVIGVENTPTWVFRLMSFLIVDLGGTVGQIARGEAAPVFVHNGVKMAPAICYEGVYGEYMGRFAREGAEVFCIGSNDAWWGDTPGHRLLFALARVRAVEHRRAVVRAANTGTSGLINSRGDVLAHMEWDEQGTLSGTVELNARRTLYTRSGDYIGRLAQYVLALCLLYRVALWARRKNKLVS